MLRVPKNIYFKFIAEAVYTDRLTPSRDLLSSSTLEKTQSSSSSYTMNNRHSVPADALYIQWWVCVWHLPSSSYSWGCPVSFHLVPTPLLSWLELVPPEHPPAGQCIHTSELRGASSHLLHSKMIPLPYHPRFLSRYTVHVVHCKLNAWLYCILQMNAKHYYRFSLEFLDIEILTLQVMYG